MSAAVDRGPRQHPIGRGDVVRWSPEFREATHAVRQACAAWLADLEKKVRCRAALSAAQERLLRAVLGALRSGTPQEVDTFRTIVLEALEAVHWRLAETSDILGVSAASLKVYMREDPVLRKSRRGSGRRPDEEPTENRPTKERKG